MAEESHEKPTANSPKGTLNQETVDTTIRTLRGIKETLKNIKVTLKVNEIEELINNINKLMSLLNGISTTSLTDSKLTEEEALGLCENEILKTTINSAELVELKAGLEAIDLDEIRKSLNRLLRYLQNKLKETLKNSFGGFNNGSNETTAQLDEYMKILKDLLFSSPDGDIGDKVAKIIKYLENLSKILFEGPIDRITFLIKWYSEYFAAVGKEVSAITTELTNAIEITNKLSISLANPNLTKIPTLIANINKIQEASVKTMNHETLLMQEVNENVFKDREFSDNEEKEQSSSSTKIQSNDVPAAVIDIVDGKIVSSK